MMRRLTRPSSWLACWMLAALPLLAQPPHSGHGSHGQGAHGNRGFEPFELAEIPDTLLVDQDGRKVRFHSDLLQDQLVAIQFIFTTCTTICPPMGAIFGQLQRELASRSGTPARLLSVSIDPATDTPERLRRWAERFDGGPGWRLVTGDKPAVDDLLKKLGVFSALKEDHAPLLLLGNAATGQWTRAYGLTSPARLADLLDELRPPQTEDPETIARTAAREYFTDLELLDQAGRRLRFYSDLVQGRTVVISTFFAECPDSCPKTQTTMARIQRMVGERLGEEVHLISITVDPEKDTPARLAGYAEGLAARPGWYFLTGPPEDVGHILGKLGQRVAQRESHRNIFLVGNDATGLWKKVFALAPADDVLRAVRSVVDDAG